MLVVDEVNFTKKNSGSTKKIFKAEIPAHDLGMLRLAKKIRFRGNWF